LGQGSKDVSEFVRLTEPHHKQLYGIAVSLCYLQGYALYKLGRLEQAARQLERALGADEARPQVLFLGGLVAYERRRWQAAVRHLEPLVASKQEPWAGPAGELLSRARRRLAEEKQVEARARHARAIQRAEEQLRGGRYREATRSLQRAEQAIPGHLLNHYYRGYLAYQQGDHPAARRHLRRALAVDPKDPWTRYMLALSLVEGAPRRERILRDLASSAKEPTVRRAARQALRGPGKRRRGGLSIKLEIGSGLDTNPAYASGPGGGTSAMPPPPIRSLPPPEPEQPPPSEPSTPGEVEPEGLAMALRGQAWLGYRRQLAPGHHGGLGVRFLEQGYAVGGEDLEQTEAAGSIDYGLQLGSVGLATRYGYTFFLLGHDPLMSLHDLDLTAGAPLVPWLRMTASVGLRWRDMHDAAYQYLEALELAGSLGIKARWKRVTLQVGYYLIRGWSEAVENTLSERRSPQGTMITLYQTDWTFLGHGPWIEVELTLPWRLSFNVVAWTLWHHFDSPDRFVVLPMNEAIWEQPRRDFQLIGRAELSRPFGHGLEAALQLSTIDSFSTLDSSTPIDRSYSRRLLVALLRWRWPMR
jgi:Flp pilus assembly protein TadD